MNLASDGAEVGRAEVQKVLDERALYTVLQPIVSLDERQVKGLEALSRFPDGAEPDHWFQTGWSVGLGKELELACIRSALDHIGQVPP